MEGLVTLLAELLVPALAAAASMLWGVFVAVVAFVVLATGLKRRNLLWPKYVAWLGGIAAAVAVFILVATYILNAFYFEPTVRFIADRVGERAHADIRYAAVEGSLIDGRLTFTKFETVRTGHQERDFTFAADKAGVKVDLLSLLPFTTPTFDEVRLENVSGRLVEHLAPGERNRSGQADGGPSGRRRPDFAVNDLRISNLAVTVEKPGGRRLIFDMPSIEAQPLRSRYALFDVMFRSNVAGSVNGHPVHISTRAISEGRVTQWEIDRMPVSILADFTGRAPFTWFEAGVADIDVQDEWQAGTVTAIDMDWRFLFDEVRIAVPDGIGLRERALVMATRKYFEAKDGRLDVAFQLELNKDRFRAFASSDAVALFNAALDAMTGAIADEVGASKEEIKKDLFGAADAVRDHLDRRRKGQ